MNVEIKTWFDPGEPSGVAKIARAALALRNRNGGFLIVGFDDNTLLPDTKPTGLDLASAFHLDRIQSIVSKYASEKFEITIGFGVRDGKQYPVITIPGGVRTPVAAKADLDDAGRKLVRHGEVYFRTLASNHTPSTTAARVEDWQEIVEICFDNREADFGRFLRRQLGGAGIRGLIEALQAIDTIPASSPSASDRAKLLLENGEGFRSAAISKRTLIADEMDMLKLGSWSVALCFDPPRQSDIADREFLSTLSSSNPQYTGWPVWLDSSGFRESADRPYVLNGGWEALIVSPGWGAHVDFMRMAPNGEFYLHRIMQDDLAADKVPPGTVLDPSLMLYRVAEVIAVGLAFGKALEFPAQETRLAFAFRWDGLSGRKLVRWADTYRDTVAYDPTLEVRINTTVEVPLDTAQQAIAPYVDGATRKLFAAFGGHHVPMSHIEERVAKLVSRTMSASE